MESLKTSMPMEHYLFTCVNSKIELLCSNIFFKTTTTKQRYFVFTENVTTLSIWGGTHWFVCCMCILFYIAKGVILFELLWIHLQIDCNMCKIPTSHPLWFTCLACIQHQWNSLREMESMFVLNQSHSLSLT